MANKGKATKTEGDWKKLSPTDLAERLETADDLIHLLQWNRGDPMLTSWEEGFMTSIVDLLRTYRGKVPLSAKQWAQIRLILDKLDADVPADED